MAGFIVRKWRSSDLISDNDLKMGAGADVCAVALYVCVVVSMTRFILQITLYAPYICTVVTYVLEKGIPIIFR